MSFLLLQYKYCLEILYQGTEQNPFFASFNQIRSMLVAKVKFRFAKIFEYCITNHIFQ